MEIAYITDHHLYPYLLPSIMSYIEHNDIEKIYVIAESEIPYELPDICEVIVVNPADYFKTDGKNYNNRWTPFVLLKCVLSRILPIDKVLYVDVDTICTDNLDELWNTELKRVNLFDGDEQTLYVAAVKENHKIDYFNAGVMLLNLKAIRDDRADQWMINYINSKPLKCPDQDAFNDVARMRKTMLPIRYNETDFTGETQEPAIVHYAAYSTWWEKHTPRYKFYEEYKQYQR